MIRVLVVDDTPLIRESLTKLIEGFNDTTVVSGNASNGQKALDWLGEYYADLCITDIRMPVMDGLGLIEQINAKYPWMMSMVVSSYDDFDYAKHSIQLRALDYILKPINLKQMKAALSTASEQLSESRRRDAAFILLKKLPHHRSWIERWLKQIRTTHTETMPLLIVETLELLEGWVEGKYYLLNELSNAWLHMLIEELTDDKIVLQLEEGKDLKMGEKRLEISSIRSYFRLCAVRRLEEGANQLISAMKGVRDQQTVRVVDVIKNYIRVHFTEDISLQSLSELVSMNKTYMCTLFKQETGTTVWNFIVAERMIAARDLLMDSSLKVYEIANQTGYENVKHFTGLFKKHYGLSPLDYKRRMKS
ncbi:response regulator transcription factor [Paenibacillus roseipurpureus]|uniref:Response regulator n=1 Tax=Paenibacillus roseopurpureus TaxID=2918901 RepID=A0AA96LPX7_9BACL|nr:response regulator [Paenibacillus sp. MBLB1832]WNR46097.1 response regulator [Paenibacillus sp. MBLB1832]